MSSFIDLKPGTRVNVTPPEDPGGATYECTIRQVTPRGMRLSTPRRDGEVLEVVPGEELAMFTMLHGRVYRFQVAVRLVEFTEYDSITVELPAEAERTERRAYYRLPTRIEPRLAMRLDDAGKEVQRLNVTVMDMSGGGMLLQVREYIPSGARIRIVLELEGEPLELDMLMQALSVQRPSTSAQYYRVNSQFIDPDRRERERVVRYIFRQQVEMRRKGVI
ncbi:MAG: PilZ domain-containing protein [Dehalococcoidia bacterium]|nr:PilZ domain-containing protein [Dehalococcoidia bacterium]